MGRVILDSSAVIEGDTDMFEVGSQRHWKPVSEPEEHPIYEDRGGSKMAPLREPEADLAKLECLLSLQIQTVNAKFFIYNLLSDSQAGRRGFDPRLSLLESASCDFLFTALPNYYPVKQRSVNQCRFQLCHGIDTAFH